MSTESPQDSKPESTSVSAVSTSNAGSSLVHDVEMEVELPWLEHELQRLEQKPGFMDEHTFKLLRKRWRSLRNCKQSNEISDEWNSKIELILGKLRKRAHRQIEVRDQNYATLTDLADKFANAMQTDNLHEALEVQTKARALLKSTQGLSDQRRKKIVRVLDRGQSNISKLRAWRRWGTNVTREQLIIEIDKLITDKSIAIPDLAKRVQDARKTWKQWDHESDSASQSLWRKFDAACNKAYLPCQVFFEKQSLRRKENCQKLEALCSTLEQRFEQTDWHNPDWRDIEKFIRQSNSTWRKRVELEHKDRRRLDKRYNIIMEQYRPHLELEQKRDRRRRELLITEIEKIDPTMDIKSAMDQVKNAQANWRPSVQGKRRDEQALWRQFTSACDAVYARLKKERNEVANAENHHLQQKRALCDQLKEVIKDTQLGADELKSKQTLLKSKWKETGSAPRKNEKELEKQFRELSRDLNKHIKAVELRQHSAVNALIKRKAQMCLQLEHAVFENQANSEFQSDWDTQWTSVDKLPEDFENSFEQRIATARAATDDAKKLEKLKIAGKENAQTAQQLCLNLEIIAEVESPPEHQRARLQAQVNRLSQAMKGDKSSSSSTTGHQDKTSEFLSLERELWLVGPLCTEDYISVTTRYEAAQKVLSG